VSERSQEHDSIWLRPLGMWQRKETDISDLMDIEVHGLVDLDQSTHLDGLKAKSKKKFPISLLIWKKV
jgi:hypothetical protein